MENKKLRAVIFGISGYAGRRLVEILLLHPFVEITAGFVAPDEPDLSIEQMYPRVAKTLKLHCTNKIDWEKIEKDCDVVFLALPHVVSMSFVPKILSLGKKVIDLSADYRFSDVNLYENGIKTYFTRIV